MEIQTESTALIFDKTDKQTPWTDINHEDYRNSWSQYRNETECNKENIDPVDTTNSKLIIEELIENLEKTEDITGKTDEPIEIVLSLNACSITDNDANTQENDPALSPPPVKRARIVKPPEAYEAERKSAKEAQGFSFLAREKENRERRDARREYYHLLTQKSSPQPFKARPAPKFKPVVVTPRKSDVKVGNFQQKTPKVVEKTPLLSATSIVAPQKLDKYKGSLLQTPKPINFPVRSSEYQNPRESRRYSNIQVTNKTPGRTFPPKNLNENGTPVMSRIPSKRTFSASNTPKVENRPPPVQTPRPLQEAQRRRSITIPKAPQLSTAIRAAERKQFEETMKIKERQREVLKKMEIATVRAYEQEAVAHLRRSTVHKPLPIRHLMNSQDPTKRPSTHPLLPTFIKRPRWV